MRLRTIATLACVVTLATQLGGRCSSSSSKSDAGCTATSSASVCSQTPLSVTDVETVIRQAYTEARAHSVTDATIVVTDRVNNVLAVFQMHPPAALGPNGGVNYRESTILSNRDPLVVGGLEGLRVPAAIAAITKAGTGAFLSSIGGAFTTRTANQITQENFNPGERFRLSGPLFGIQFSQLPCSDFSRRFGVDGAAGPKRLPLGFTTDPGGIPLYNADGVPVGGVGIEIGNPPAASAPAAALAFDNAEDVRWDFQINERPGQLPFERNAGFSWNFQVIAFQLVSGGTGLVTNDRDIFNTDTQIEERIAVAASRGFSAPSNRQANLIALDGRTLRFVDDNDVVSNPASAPAFAALEGSLISVSGWYDMAGGVLAGTEFLTPESGFVSGQLSSQGEDINVEFIVTPGGMMNAYEPADSGSPAVGAGGLTQNEVTTILFETLKLAQSVRGQVRRPLGEPARISVGIVDTAGTILGFARSPDGLLFGPDVAVQKARTAAFFSDTTVEADLAAAGMGSYYDDTRDFLDNPNHAFTGSIGYSTTSIGGLSRPFFPNGINGNGNGPLSNPFAAWSQFSTGLQLDSIAAGILLSLCSGDTANNPAYESIDALVSSLGLTCTPPSPPTTCTDPTLSTVANGFQIFSGGVPIYRGTQLIGGIGISGDGAEQDDLISIVGLGRANRAMEALLGQVPAPPGFDSPAPGNTPHQMRSDTVTVGGDHLRYVRCAVSPFLDSDTQRACEDE